MTGSGEVVEKTTKPQRPDDYRAAAWMFQLLGSPTEFDNVETRDDWKAKMRDCMGEAEMGIDEFKKFLTWVLEANPYSVEYMRNARNPAATLLKNVSGLLRRYRGVVKREEIEAKRHKREQAGQPEYRRDSGKSDLLKEEEL